jgi:FdhD protein
MPVDLDGVMRTVPRRIWRSSPAGQGGAAGQGARAIAVETPVAIVVNGTTFAVLLASPENLADFGIGFAFSEGIVAAPDDIGSIDIVAQPDGIEVQLWIADRLAQAANARRRRLAGPTGCGLCGIESLAEANRPPIICAAPGPMPTPAEILAAMAGLSALQPVGAATRAVHAAGLWQRGQPMLVREDVGRHNALDKLIGAARSAGLPTHDAMLLLTSRVSIEMIQKASSLGAPIVVAVSAPTSLAIDTAVLAELTLVAVARPDGFEVFNRADRIDWPLV